MFIWPWFFDSPLMILFPQNFLFSNLLDVVESNEDTLSQPFVRHDGEKSKSRL